MRQGRPYPLITVAHFIGGQLESKCLARYAAIRRAIMRVDKRNIMLRECRTHRKNNAATNQSMSRQLFFACLTHHDRHNSSADTAQPPQSPIHACLEISFAKTGSRATPAKTLRTNSDIDPKLISRAKYNETFKKKNWIPFSRAA